MRRRAWAAAGSPCRQYAVPGEPAKLVAASDGQRKNQPEHRHQDQPEGLRNQRGYGTKTMPLGVSVPVKVTGLTAPVDRSIMPKELAGN